VSHCGGGSEAGGDGCYIKFGAARSEMSFEALLDACETLAASKNLKRLIAGANVGREKAWKRLIGRGFLSDFQGVAMQRHNDPGYTKLLKGSQDHLQSTSSSRLDFTPDPSNVLTGGRSTHPDFWQVGVVLKPEALSPQTSHRAWLPEGLCT
jgi:hypothetical protein